MGKEGGLVGRRCREGGGVVVEHGDDIADDPAHLFFGVLGGSGDVWGADDIGVILERR